MYVNSPLYMYVDNSRHVQTSSSRSDLLHIKSYNLQFATRERMNYTASNFLILLQESFIIFARHITVECFCVLTSFCSWWGYPSLCFTYLHLIFRWRYIKSYSFPGKQWKNEHPIFNMEIPKGVALLFYFLVRLFWLHRTPRLWTHCNDNSKTTL